MNRSKLASRTRSPSSDAFTTIERSCIGSFDVSASAPSDTAPSLGDSEYSDATPASDAASPKPRSTDTDAPVSCDGSDTHTTSPPLTHRAATDPLPKRHSVSSNGWNPLPSTRTTVDPADTPLLGLRLVTADGSWYTNGTLLVLYCWPFIEISTATLSPDACAGVVHVRLPPSTTDARTDADPNRQR